MTDQHTVNHNDDFTFSGALHNNHYFETVVKDRDRLMDDARLTIIPWKQYHRANVLHLARHSN